MPLAQQSMSKHVGNMTLVAQCTSPGLHMHGSARLCLSLCLPVFVLGRGHLGSFSNKWHSVAILLQVTQPLDFIYHECWLRERHRLQIVPMIICMFGTLYLYNQMTEIQFSGIYSGNLQAVEWNSWNISDYVVFADICLYFKHKSIVR